MVIWQSKTLNINNIKIHYLSTTIVEEKPTLIFLHGLSDSGACFKPIASAFTDNFNIILPDARGHGKSEMPEHGFDYGVLASDVLILIKKLNINMSPVIIGHSMGAMTVLRFAATFHDHIKAGILEDPVFLLPERKNNHFKKEPRINGFLGFIEQFKDKSIEEIVDKGKKQNPGWSQAELVPWAEAKLQFNQKNPKLFLSKMDKLTNWQQELKQVFCPLLVIRAEHSLLKDNAAEITEQLIKNGRIVNLGQAGHNIRREQTEAYMTELNQFLLDCCK